MTYMSVEFIFFLFAGAAVTFVLPAVARKFWLLIMSFLWMASWKPEWALLFFLLGNINFFIQDLADKKSSLRNGLLQGLLIFDFWVFLILRSGGISEWTFIPPYGTSFILFLIMGQVFERWRNQDSDKYSWIEYMLFSQFFLFLMGGPVERASKFIGEIRKNNNFQFTQMVDGILIMGTGFIKIIILWSAVSAFSLELAGHITHWIFFLPLGLLSTWKVYLELSSLADIGRGAARVLGIHATVNFRPVLFSRSPADFWLRWNISIGTWIRNNVTIPLLLKYGRNIPRDFIILASFILMGIWHGIGFHFVLFGLFNGAMIILYNWTDHRKFPGSVGILLAIILMIGNGIIPHIFDLKLSTVSAEGLDVLFLRHFGISGLVTMGLLLTLEITQEIKKDVDFYLSYPLWLKVLFSSAMILLLIYALDRNLLTQHKMMDLPIYFRM